MHCIANLACMSGESGQPGDLTIGSDATFGHPPNNFINALVGGRRLRNQFASTHPRYEPVLRSPNILRRRSYLIGPGPGTRTPLLGTTYTLQPISYSLLNETFGSTRLARNAGTSDATTEIANNTPAPAEKT